jgi:hypothetical protein
MLAVGPVYDVRLIDYDCLADITFSFSRINARVSHL